MAIAFVQSASSTFSSGSSITVTLGAGTTAGNCLVVATGNSGSGSNKTVTGITLGGAADNFAQQATVGDGTNSVAIVEIWADPNCAGGQTSVVITYSAAPSTGCVWVYEFSGVATSSILDKSHAAFTDTTQATWNSGTTATTTQASELWFGANAGFSTTTTGPASPWNNSTVLTSGARNLIAGYQIVSSTGTAAYSGTYSPDSYETAVVVTLLGAAGGTSHTATGSLTVTPSFSAARTRGRFRTGSLTVTPSFSASRTRGRFRTGSLTVTPSFSSSRTMARARHGSLLVSPGFTAIPAHTSTAVARPAGGWWQLHSIIKWAEQEREFYQSQPPMACPRDGEPFMIAPPSDSGATVELFCRFCGFRYPGDWDATTMSGM